MQKKILSRAYWIFPLWACWMLWPSQRPLPAPSQSPEAAPLLSNALGKDSAWVLADEAFEYFRQQQDFVGLSVAIAYQGRIVYAQGFGWADSSARIAMEPWHQMRIASVSKWITALAIMQLVEEGRLQLSDKAFGPQGILQDSLYGKVQDPRIFEIEVEHLLRHTAGFCRGCQGDPMFQTLEIAQAAQVPPPASWEVIVGHVFQKQKLIWSPGQVFNYSNFGYVALEKIIEKVSGLPYEQYLRQRLLQKAGIENMYLGKTLPSPKQKREVHYYDQAQAPLLPSVFGTGDSLSRVYGGGNYIEILGGAGAWVASPAQLLKLLALADGLPQPPDLLSAASIEAMRVPSDTAHRHTVMGWKEVNEWGYIRTGSYAGTNALLVQQKDGWSYCLLTNQSLWSAGKFQYEALRLMKRLLPILRDKLPPEKDLAPWVY
jgi:CubicO group peptidase (beta-lactamase class C family)